MWFMDFGDVHCAVGKAAQAASAKAHFARQSESAKRCAEAKKKARPMGDAPSNRTFGNCLLGLHCSQNESPGTRVIAGVPAVAAIRQQNLSTSHQQVCG
jgi:hypothetical protein